MKKRIQGLTFLQLELRHPIKPKTLNPKPSTLGGNGIGDEGARRLAEGLGECSSLAWLDLKFNRIGDEGITMIRTCIRDTVELNSYLPPI